MSAPHAYPTLPTGTKELWFEEEILDHDDDPKLQAVVEASHRSLVEDEIRCWEQVLREALPPRFNDDDEQEPWYLQLERELEQERVEQGLPLPPPLSPGLHQGQSWMWTGGSWSLERPAQPQEAA